MGARDSGTIDHSEGEMIKGVLNLQTQRVKEIMRPRVGKLENCLLLRLKFYTYFRFEI